MPDAVESFVDKAPALLSDRHHGVLLAGATLMLEMCTLDAALVQTYRAQARPGGPPRPVQRACTACLRSLRSACDGAPAWVITMCCAGKMARPSTYSPGGDGRAPAFVRPGLPVTCAPASGAACARRCRSCARSCAAC